MDLLVLKEVVAKMGGVEVVEDLTDQQLQAQAGGEALRFEAAPVKVIIYNHINSILLLMIKIIKSDP